MKARIFGPKQLVENSVENLNAPRSHNPAHTRQKCAFRGDAAS